MYASMIVHMNKVLVVGGEHGHMKFDRAVQAYDPATQTWTVSDIKLPLGLTMHHTVLIDILEASNKTCCIM